MNVIAVDGGPVSADTRARERSWPNGGVHEQARAKNFLQKPRCQTHWSPDLQPKIHTRTGHDTRVCGAQLGGL